MTGTSRSHARGRLLRAPVLRHRSVSGTDVSTRVTLPRASWTVPLARRLVRTLLRHPLVSEDGRVEVETALCEACTNAVRHAAPATHYDLRLRIHNATCQIEGADDGSGLGLTDEPPLMPDTQAVSGRGLALIAYLTDQFEIRRRHPTGTLLRFVKHLRVEPNAVPA